MALLEPPDYIDDLAKEKFRELVAMIHERLQPTDIYLVAEFCQGLADIVTLMDAIRLEGDVITTETGARKMNPNTMLLLSRRQSVSSMRQELGLSPKARKEKAPRADTKKSLKDLI
jgi:P27 family predicted phage terminase small subunit